MKITEVKVFTVDEERLKAYVTIVLDDCFVIRDLKVINGNTGLFVAMPSKKRRDGSYRDIAHPLNQETRTEVEEQVLKAYVDEVSNPSEDLSDNLSENTGEDSSEEDSGE